MEIEKVYQKDLWPNDKKVEPINKTESSENDPRKNKEEDKKKSKEPKKGENIDVFA